jgi:hypothetical protein
MTALSRSLLILHVRGGPREMPSLGKSGTHEGPGNDTPEAREPLGAA